MPKLALSSVLLLLLPMKARVDVNRPRGQLPQLPVQGRTRR